MSVAAVVADVLTQAQVCRQLGISDDTWTRWRKAGRTPVAVTMPSGRLRWRRDDIEALVGNASVASPRRRYFVHATTVAPTSSVRTFTSGEFTKGEGR